MRIYKPTRSWRDTVAELAATFASLAIFIHFDLNEALYALTRWSERVQLDELPFGLLVLSIGLLWPSWRRYKRARRDLEWTNHRGSAAGCARTAPQTRFERPSSSDVRAHAIRLGGLDRW